MSEGASFRFIQSGDFHLDQPLGGLSNVPDHLRDLFCDAARSATKNVFENAVLHDVDFVLLTGNLLDVRRSTPKTIGFLLEQFETLNKAGIQVYWAGGSIDPPVRWPASIALPAVFSTCRATVPLVNDSSTSGRRILAITMVAGAAITLAASRWRA